MRTHAPRLRITAVLALNLVLIAGCGQGPTNNSARISRDLKPIDHGKNKPDPKAGTQIEAVMQEAAKMASEGQALDKLSPGKYTLAVLSSDYHFSEGSETLRVFHRTSVSTDGRTLVFAETETKPAGTLSKDPKSSRVVGMPSTFTVTAPPWTPSATDISATVAVKDELVVADKTYSIKDSLVGDLSSAKISLLEILASPTPDGMTVDTNIPVTLKLRQLADGKTVRFVISIAEKSASKANTTAATETVTENRNLYLDYTLTEGTPADPAAAAPGKPALEAPDQPAPDAAPSDLKN